MKYDIKEIISKIYFKLANEVIFYKNHVNHGKFSIKGTIKIYRDNPIISHKPYKSIFIGEGFGCNSGLRYNPIGGDICTILRTIDNGIIRIGNNVGISNASIVAWNLIEIEDNVTIGGGVKIYDTDFHSLDYETRIFDPYEDIISKPIKICKGVFIGAGCYILKGVTIGEKSIVGAGSVVTKDIPAGEIWAGNPCRFVKKIDCKHSIMSTI